MRKFLKNGVECGLGLFGKFPAVMTDKREIETLVRSLRPHRVNNAELIRLGPNGDGGYLVPNDLDGVEAIFSPGVSLVSGFEKDCAALGIKSYLADRSVAGPAEQDGLFHFTRKHIGATSNADFMTLDEWVTGSVASTASDLMLQIDIEGYEYEVFLAVTDALMKRFRVVVVEFHSLYQLWVKSFFNMANSVFKKIQQTHTCVHIHPNNCCGAVAREGLEIPRAMEFTFYRNDRIEASCPESDFPHKLDCDNTDRPPLNLPRCWYT